mmetsp:Transcript_6125/g.17474  ORF Transcript_6125/g.17474 Transcript_6125/m.17474 type:complete len:227 (+) Transcript_6125:195-875(+)
MLRRCHGPRPAGGHHFDRRVLDPLCCSGRQQGLGPPLRSEPAPLRLRVRHPLHVGHGVGVRPLQPGELPGPPAEGLLARRIPAPRRQHRGGLVGRRWWVQRRRGGQPRRERLGVEPGSGRQPLRRRRGPGREEGEGHAAEADERLAVLVHRVHGERGHHLLLLFRTRRGVQGAHAQPLRLRPRLHVHFRLSLGCDFAERLLPDCEGLRRRRACRGRLAGGPSVANG